MGAFHFMQCADTCAIRDCMIVNARHPMRAYRQEKPPPPSIPETYIFHSVQRSRIPLLIFVPHGFRHPLLQWRTRLYRIRRRYGPVPYNLRFPPHDMVLSRRALQQFHGLDGGPSANPLQVSQPTWPQSRHNRPGQHRACHREEGSGCTGDEDHIS